MPDSIGTVSQLVGIIRSQLTAIENSAIKSRASTRTKDEQSGTTKNLDTLIGQRIKSIDRDDPQRGRKAFRIFLESILLSHFGENLINDPKFYQMVEDIQNAMESDSTVKAQIDMAIAHLLSA
jgi:hypothetical protein